MSQSSSLLRILRRSSLERACQTRPVAVRQWRTKRSYADSKGDGGKSFHGQLYDSTAQRIQRERAEAERFANERSRGGGGNTAAITFTIFTFSAICYYLGTLRPAPTPDTSTIPLSASKEPEHNVSPTNLQAAWADFVAIVGEDNVSTEENDVESHTGSDWSSHSALPSERPFCVVYPATTEEVSKIMKICHKRRIPVTAYSGGTSLEGHYAAIGGGITIDFNRMDNIVQLHKDDLDVVVQPAVGWEMLNAELAKDGLFFPPDPGPGAMIGGMVGTGCSGTNAYRYGTMKDWVISLTVVLADGTIIKTRQRPRKSSAGYDLTRIFVGSEGTLGLVTEATLKLTPKPKSESVAVASFPSVLDAAKCVARVVKDGIPIAAIEILDDVQMKVINEAGATKKKWTEAPTLFMKFTGTPQAVKEQIGLVRDIAKSTGYKTFEFARSEEERTELWSARKEALFSVVAAKENPSDRVWTTDVAVPISKLPEIVEETKEKIQASGLLGTIVGHVGDGNFHTILLFNESQKKTAEELVHFMVKRAVELEGTVTGEHGVGLVKRDYLPHELGEETVAAMRKIKAAFDPLCLLNCNKTVRVAPPKSGEVKKW